jgi:hypothetical protein
LLHAGHEWNEKADAIIQQRAREARAELDAKPLHIRMSVPSTQSVKV